MNDLKVLLDNINLSIWFFDALCLYMFYHVCQKSAKIYSSFIAMIVVFIVSWLMMGYQGMLDWYIEAHPGFNPVVNFFWYMGFATFYILAMVILRKAHELANIPIATLGQYLNWSFFILVCIQLFQYGEIVLFKTDVHMDKIYQIGIPTINIATTVVSFALAILALYHVDSGDKNLEGIKRWSI